MRLSYLWYVGSLLFIIPIILDSNDNKINGQSGANQVSDSNTMYTFFPNEQCTTVAYIDTVNCGSSEASLVKNPQNFVWCKFNIPNRKMHNEPFAGIEIWFKDPKKVIDISNFDYIEINMIGLSSDSSSAPFEMHCHSRLKYPEKLPAKDTLPCDDPLRKPNRRYDFSVKYTEFQLQKNNFISTFAINSLVTPRWYKNTVVENFDKERFFSLCIQTGNPFPLNTEYTVIISSIIFKKTTQNQPVINSSSVHKSHHLITVLSLVSFILYILVITLLIRIRSIGKSDKGESNQTVLPSASSTDTQLMSIQSSKPEQDLLLSDTVPIMVTDDTSMQNRPTPPLPLDAITINVLRKIAENPKLSTDDVARDNNKDSSTICKRIERDFGKGITISKLRLYFTALDIRNKNIDIDSNELHNHANKVITDAHGKLKSYKDLQDIASTLQQKCPNDILDFFKNKYGDIQF